MPKKKSKKNAIERKAEEDFVLTGDAMQRSAGIYLIGNQKKICIEFQPFSWEEVKWIKENVPGRRFKNAGPGHKFWTCPLKKKNIRILKERGYKLSDELTNFLNTDNKTLKKRKEEGADSIIDNYLKSNLYPFQKRGVQFLSERQGLALLADEQGIGKTIQALAYLRINPETRPCLIICPATVKINWLREAGRWLDSMESIEVVYGQKPYMLHSNVVIINYDILTHWADYLRDRFRPQCIIADEAHFFKNNKSKRTKAVKKLAKSVPHFIALTGTPIVSKPIEAYNALRIVADDIIPAFWTFARRYCNAKHDGFKWNVEGASRTDELHNMIDGTCMLRRRKSEVLPELPERQYSFIPMEIDNQSRKRYLAKMAELKGENPEEDSAVNILQQIEAAKQECVAGKMKEVINWTEDFLHDENKLLLFTTHRITVEALVEEFQKYGVVKIDGSVSSKQRETAQQKFCNDDNTRLMIANIKAAGVGMNLHKSCSNVGFVELPWTPGELSQAIDRVHRIGQSEQVNVYYLLAENTIEEMIAEKLDEKQKVLDSVLDGKETDEKDMIKELMQNYKED